MCVCVFFSYKATESSERVAVMLFDDKDDDDAAAVGCVLLFAVAPNIIDVVDTFNLEAGKVVLVAAVLVIFDKLLQVVESVVDSDDDVVVAVAVDAATGFLTKRCCF